MHVLTSSGDYRLELILKRNDDSIKTLNWEAFKLNGENDKFRLSTSGSRADISGLSDRFQHHNWKKIYDTV